jgi:hypothetical protein
VLGSSNEAIRTWLTDGVPQADGEDVEDGHAT